ncbi:MAG TPA: hypothetical protein VFB23_11345 [Candidatus Acidoferrales bacterium]|nr:hypothetical protein [Candidatus Acidoferrales bacterium]
MSEPLCRDCQEQTGAHVKATRILKTGPRCDMHYRKIMGLPPVKSFVEVKSGVEPTEPKKKEEAKPVSKYTADKAAAQRDRDAGMASNEIAEKYKVPTWWVYQNTKGSSSARAASTNGERIESTGRVDRRRKEHNPAGPRLAAGARAAKRTNGNGAAANGDGNGALHIEPSRIERLLDRAWSGLSLEAKLALMEKES